MTHTLGSLRYFWKSFIHRPLASSYGLQTWFQLTKISFASPIPGIFMIVGVHQTTEDD